MRFVLGVCFAWSVVASSLAQGPTKAALVLTCVKQKSSYAPDETVNLNVTIENRGPSPFYIYQPLEWGWTGLWFGLVDATGHRVRPKHPVIAPLPPPPLRDRSQLIDLEPGYFYGRHLDFKLRDYDLEPGTYFLVFTYRSNYSPNEGFGLPILTWDDGEIVANKIEISVR